MQNGAKDSLLYKEKQGIRVVRLILEGNFLSLYAYEDDPDNWMVMDKKGFHKWIDAEYVQLN